MAKSKKKSTQRPAVHRTSLSTRAEMLEAIISLTINETDRGCIIVFNALLDESLEELITKHLTRMSGERKLVADLLDGKRKGALGPFNARVKAAVAMGILSAEWLEPLSAFGKVRNDFAHNSNTRQFTQEHVDKITGKIKGYWKTALARMFRKMDEESQVTKWSATRQHFTCAAILLVWQLRRHINTDKRRLRLIAKALENTFTMSLPNPRRKSQR